MDTIETPADAGRQIRELRKSKGLSQEQLANRAGVSRKFVAEFEAGHERAELGKALRVMHAAGYGLRAEPLPEPAHTENPIQELIDDAATTIRLEIRKGDPEFALRILADTVTKLSQCTHAGQLCKPPSTRIPRWDKLLATAIGYGLRRAGTDRPTWTHPTPLPCEWFPYEFRAMTPQYKELTIKQTPRELAEAGIYLRERSLRLPQAHHSGRGRFLRPESGR